MLAQICASHRGANQERELPIAVKDNPQEHGDTAVSRVFTKVFILYKDFFPFSAPVMFMVAPSLQRLPPQSAGHLLGDHSGPELAFGTLLHRKPTESSFSL